MKFTSELPTEPGFYAVKHCMDKREDVFKFTNVVLENGRLVCKHEDFGEWAFGNELDNCERYCTWCRLIPESQACRRWVVAQCANALTKTIGCNGHSLTCSYDPDGGTPDTDYCTCGKIQNKALIAARAELERTA